LAIQLKLKLREGVIRSISKVPKVDSTDLDSLIELFNSYFSIRNKIWWISISWKFRKNI